MSSFSLRAHVNGIKQSISASQEVTGVTLTGDCGQRHVRTMRQAQRIAHDYIGNHLGRANGSDRLWGLVVWVPGFSALYGTPHPEAGLSLGGGAPADPNSLPMRIYSRWRKTDSPGAALENAMQIIRAVVGDGNRAAA